jgi:hypothetical protein
MISSIPNNFFYIQKPHTKLITTYLKIQIHINNFKKDVNKYSKKFVKNSNI